MGVRNGAQNGCQERRSSCAEELSKATEMLSGRGGLIQRQFCCTHSAQAERFADLPVAQPKCLISALLSVCRSPTEPRVHLLYRPGHYDILYLHPAAGTAGGLQRVGQCVEPGLGQARVFQRI
jgi:hypothetical protein